MYGVIHILVNNDDSIVINATERVCGTDDVYADYMFGRDRNQSTGVNGWLNASNVNLIKKVEVFENNIIMSKLSSDNNKRQYAIGWNQSTDANRKPGCNAPQPTALFNPGANPEEYNAGWDNNFFFDSGDRYLLLLSNPYPFHRMWLD